MNTSPESAQEFLQLIEDSLVQAKKAYSELQKEREERVRLEKVASDRTAANKQIVNDIVSILVNEDFIDDSEMQKYATLLIDNPDKVRNVVTQLVKFSIPSSEEGVGIPKQASSVDGADASSEKAAWQRCVEEGA